MRAACALGGGGRTSAGVVSMQGSGQKWPTSTFIFLLLLVTIDESVDKN